MKSSAAVSDPAATPGAARKRTRDPNRGPKILEAARRLFYERGFHAVSVDEIGEAAGATGAAIYRHFSGKDEILATLFDAAQDRYLLAVPDAHDDPWAELDQLVERHLSITLDNRELATIWSHEARQLSAPHGRRLRRRNRQYLDSWLTCLRRALPQHDDRQLLTAANAAIAATLSLATNTGHVPTAREITVVSQMVRSGLRSLASPESMHD
jgi:AcrR family transcriptional regulator